MFTVCRRVILTLLQWISLSHSLDNFVSHHIKIYFTESSPLSLMDIWPKLMYNKKEIECKENFHSSACLRGNLRAQRESVRLLYSPHIEIFTKKQKQKNFYILTIDVKQHWNHWIGLEEHHRTDKMAKFLRLGIWEPAKHHCLLVREPS